MRAAKVALAALCAAAASHTVTAWEASMGTGIVANIPAGTPGAATLQLQPELTQIDQQAVCSDGSPAGYYFRPGSGSGENTWVLYLEGGFFCWDGQSCDQRFNATHYQMSSVGFPATTTLDGIFGTDPSQNPFYNANLALVKYCSSDSWFGDAPASNTTYGYAFRGARIVRAAVQALQEVNGMGNATGSADLLLAGCSAGGRGVMANIDQLSVQNPDITIRGFMDASTWVDIQPPSWENGLMSLQSMTQQLMTMAQAPVPSTCAEAFPGQQMWKCLWPSYRMPMLHSPYFLSAAQFDAFELGYNTGDQAPTNSTEFAYSNSFQTATLSLFARLRPTVAIQSTSCETHCLSGSSDFYNFTVNGVSLAEAMNVWYFGGEASYRNIEACVGYDCTFQCEGAWEPINVDCKPYGNRGCGKMAEAPEADVASANSAKYYEQYGVLPQSPPPGAPAAPVPVPAPAPAPVPAAAAPTATDTANASPSATDAAPTDAAPTNTVTTDAAPTDEAPVPAAGASAPAAGASAPAAGASAPAAGASAPVSAKEPSLSPVQQTTMQGFMVDQERTQTGKKTKKLKQSAISV